MTDDPVNPVLVPLRNSVCDFKDNTNMSWAVILPAIQRISVRLLIQAYGRDRAQELLESMVRKMEEKQGICPKVVRMTSLFPEISSEQLPQLAKLNALLWHVVDETIATGCPVIQVAQGFSSFVAMVASRNIDQFGEFYAAGLLHASHRGFQSGAFDYDKTLAGRATG